MDGRDKAANERRRPREEEAVWERKGMAESGTQARPDVEAFLMALLNGGTLETGTQC